MEYSSVNVKHFSNMNFTNQKLFFHKGMIFTGKVKQIYPNHFATLQVGERTLNAKLDIALQMDQTYCFLIDQISETGIPYISIIGNKQIKDPYRLLLEKLSLPKDTISKKLVQKLTETQITIDLGDIKTSVNLLRGIPPETTETAIQTILFMIKHHLPRDKNIFDSLMTFFVTKSISKKLSSLYSQILLTGSKTEEIENFKKWFSGLDRNTDYLPTKLLKLLGINYESAVLKNYLSHMKLISNESQLKPILMGLLQSKNNPDKIKKIAQEILNWTTGQQLANYNIQETQPNYIFQIPIFIQKQPLDLWIKMEGYRKDNGKLNSENNKLFFYICLTNLNETAVQVTIQKKIISIKIYNEIDLSPLVPLYTPQLKERLKAYGYYLSSVNCCKTNAASTYFFTTESSEFGKVDRRI